MGKELGGLVGRRGKGKKEGIRMGLSGEVGIKRRGGRESVEGRVGRKEGMNGDVV